MDAAIPSFILGYHGCDKKLAEDVFAGKVALKPSKNDYDWLGDGIYFWEHNAQRAYDFAVDMSKQSHPSGQKIKTPAVVGAVINLGNCLNLLDSRYIKMVKQAYDDLKECFGILEIEVPKNSGGTDLFRRNLDCAVLRLLHGTRNGAKQKPFDSVRAAFFEGKQLYENAGFASKNHIQICVRKHEQIIGYFRPMNEKGQPIKFA